MELLTILKNIEKITYDKKVVYVKDKHESKKDKAGNNSMVKK